MAAWFDIVIPVIFSAVIGLYSTSLDGCHHLTKRQYHKVIGLKCSCESEKRVSVKGECPSERECMV